MTDSDHTIGNLNRGNGICGFVACIYMACRIDPRRAPTIVQSNLARRTIVDIAHFLQECKKTNPQLFRDIETFTWSLDKEKYKEFNLNQFIHRCNLCVNRSEDDILNDGDYDVAMPPEGVSAYIKSAWGIDTTEEKVIGGNSGSENCILGLCQGSGGFYNGLQHWVYRHNGIIYSYGVEFDDLADFNYRTEENYTVGWVVKVS